MIHTWDVIKNFISTRTVSIQYVDLGDRYLLKVFDGPFELECNLDKNNDSDVIDFETNYKPLGNYLLGASQSGILVDHSGTTSSVAKTSTQMVAKNVNRKFILIQNVDASTIWINFTSVATIGQPSIELLAGSSLVLEGTSITPELINVISSVASMQYTVKEK